MLKRFFAYYKPHRVIFTFDMLASLLVAMIAIVYPMITREMLKDYIPNANYRMIVIAGAGLLRGAKFFAAGGMFERGELLMLAVGTATAFLVSLVTIRFLMDFVRRHTFKSFGVYRIVLGVVVLLTLL